MGETDAGTEEGRGRHAHMRSGHSHPRSISPLPRQPRPTACVPFCWWCRFTYERRAIQEWMDRSAPGRQALSPMTNLPLAHTALTPNLAMQSEIRQWTDEHRSGA